LKVVVDALAASSGGGVTYLRSILAQALDADPSLEIVLVVARSDSFDVLADHPRVRILSPLGPSPSLVRRLTWEAAVLPREARQLGGDVLFSPSEIAPLRSGLPVVLGLQNPNLYERPVRYASPLQELRLRLLLLAARASARRAAALVFVSEPFRRRAAPALASRAPVFVAEPPLDTVFREPRPDQLGRFASLRPYILSVSDFYPYKNFTVLVDAFDLLQRDDLRLIIAGRPVDRHSHEQTRQRIRELGLGKRVLLTGAVQLAEMPSLYAGAECFVFPSLLESYGFPPFEAMACSTPVVTSDASVMPELIGDAAAYVNAREARAIAAEVTRVLDNCEYADALRERGLQRVARMGASVGAEALLNAFRLARATADT